MSKGKNDKTTCKPYDQWRARLMPPGVDEIIPESHLARLASEATDELGMARPPQKQQAGGGASRRQPEMTAKLFVCGYMTRARSSRTLAKAAGENVTFMWLSGWRRPDFRAPSGFRAKALEAKGRVKLENCFVDGTKIESAAGRRAFARKKAVGTSGRRLDGKSRAYIRMAEDIWEGENRERVEKGLEEPGGKEGLASRDARELAGASRERLERLDGEKDGERKKN
jgi:transposase